MTRKPRSYARNAGRLTVRATSDELLPEHCILCQQLGARPRDVADETASDAGRPERVSKGGLYPGHHGGDAVPNAGEDDVEQCRIRPKVLQGFKSCRPRNPERSCGGQETGLHSHCRGARSHETNCKNSDAWSPQRVTLRARCHAGDGSSSRFRSTGTAAGFRPLSCNVRRCPHPRVLSEQATPGLARRTCSPIRNCRRTRAPWMRSVRTFPMMYPTPQLPNLVVGRPGVARRSTFT